MREREWFTTEGEDGGSVGDFNGIEDERDQLMAKISNDIISIRTELERLKGLGSKENLGREVNRAKSHARRTESRVEGGLESGGRSGRPLPSSSLTYSDD